ncbi:MAG: LytTR family DNA-binding domain-containing protein [Bacteroidia bacterium]
MAAYQLKTIVVDDDALQRKILTHCVNTTPFLEFVGEASNALEALELMDAQKVDVVFLDIMMPKMTGIELIESMQHAPQVVLVTADKSHAAKAYDLNVTDYLVKPVDLARFTTAANKVKFNYDANKNLQESNFVLVKNDGVIVKLLVNDILYIEALADYVNIHTTQKRITVLSTMKGMEDKLGKDDFMRIHRSFIINVNKIAAMQTGTVRLINSDIDLPISRTYNDELKAKLVAIGKGN